MGISLSSESTSTTSAALSSSPPLDTTNEHVVFIGDSTLDNVVWVKSQSECITAQLQSMLSSTSAKVTNYAADGFNSRNTLHGAYPGISMRRRTAEGDPFPDFGGKVFKPLEELEKLNKDKAVSHVVLSVGGNDIREILGKMQELPVKVKSFLENYPVILERILKVTPNVIIMLQYRPALNQDEVYGVYRAMRGIAGDDPVESINAFMESIYPPIFHLARLHNLAIIDLPNTFDINDDDLYRSQIEPSQKGGKIISELIKHVMEYHNGTTSKLYRLEQEGNSSKIIEIMNDSGSEWKVGNSSSKKVTDMFKTVMSSS